MRNSVILVDQVQTEMDAGRDPWNAVRRSGRAPDASGGADRGGHRARDDSADAQRVLGPDGDRDHGRPHGRDGADDLLRAGALRGVVQGASAPLRRMPWNRPPCLRRRFDDAMIATCTLSHARRLRACCPRVPARRLRDESCVDADACDIHRTEREAAVRRRVVRFSSVRRSICSSLPIARRRRRRHAVYGRALAFHRVRLDR